jgi:hypothetical protein
MKGMVFTELMEFVEEQFGFDVADAVVEKSKTSTDGVFTQAGNYPFEDLLSLVVTLSEEVNVPVPDLVKAYGRHLFGIIVKLYPPMIAGFDNPLKFIAQVDTFIHPEVLKLYPDADLPEFQMISLDGNVLVIDYISAKGLVPFAEGLSLGCGDYFDRELDISYEVLEEEPKMRARMTMVMK